jgi:hypothetical protein
VAWTYTWTRTSSMEIVDHWPDALGHRHTERIWTWIYSLDMDTQHGHGHTTWTRTCRIFSIKQYVEARNTMSDTIGLRATKTMLPEKNSSTIHSPRFYGGTSHDVVHTDKNRSMIQGPCCYGSIHRQYAI